MSIHEGSNYQAGLGNYAAAQSNLHSARGISNERTPTALEKIESLNTQGPKLWPVGDAKLRVIGPDGEMFKPDTPPLTEPLSDAITTYACGPLSPGERHEARVVARKGCLRVVYNTGDKTLHVKHSARDPDNGNALDSLLTERDGDSFTIAVPHVDEDVVVEIVVVRS